MNNIELKNLILSVHQDNREMGWWESERSTETFHCLFSSELIEAMEGIRKNIMDDKLPHLRNDVVEMADYVIRLMDYLGNEYKDKPEELEMYLGICDEVLLVRMQSLMAFELNTKYISRHLSLMADFERHVRNEDTHKANWVLLGALTGALAGMQKAYGGDFLAVIEEKRAFNLKRADHKLANRKSGKPGAKAF